MYNVWRDADGNVHEYIKQPGKNDKYVINGMPPGTAFHPSHHCRSGGIGGHVWAGFNALKIAPRISCVFSPLHPLFTL